MVSSALDRLPEGWLAKFYFLLYIPYILVLSLIGRSQVLCKLVQPFVDPWLHRVPTYKWNELLFIAKCMGLDSARTLRAGHKFKDIPLNSMKGDNLRLKDFLQGRALILNFGSLREFNELVIKYKDSFAFLTIYIREAHAGDGEWPDSTIQTHKKLSDRLEAAQILAETGVEGDLVVDSMLNLSVFDYGALPERWCLLNADGTVNSMSRMGPWGYSLVDLEQKLQNLLKGHKSK